MTYLSRLSPNERHERHTCHTVTVQASWSSLSVTRKSMKSVAVTAVTLMTGKYTPLGEGMPSVTQCVTQASRLVDLVPMVPVLSGGGTVYGTVLFSLPKIRGKLNG